MFPNIVLYNSYTQLGIIATVKNFARVVSDYFQSLIDAVDAIVAFVTNIPHLLVTLFEQLTFTLTLPAKLLTFISSLTFLPAFILTAIAFGFSGLVISLIIKLL